MSYFEDNGIDKKKLASIVRRLNKIGKELDEMGLHLFGWSGSGCVIRMDDDAPEGAYIIADLTTKIDGGDPSYEYAPE
jgi:hypothetical protein